MLRTTLSLFALALALGACTAPAADVTESHAAAVSTLTDAQIAEKLGTLIAGAQWMSEADYGYTLIEGDGSGLVKVNEAAVRKRLAGVLQAKSEDHRDIRPASVRGEYIKVTDMIDDFTAEANDPTAEDYMRENAQKLSASLRFMNENLTSVAVFTFGTNESGDGDGEGNVLYVFVGLSKSGQLIGMFTEAVYT